MFTGLVEGCAKVIELRHEAAGVRLILDTTDTPLAEPNADGIDIGASIAINGCCLTVVACAETSLAFQAGSETLSKTNLGQLKTGQHVNLERSLPMNGRLGGHLVQGHVDGLGRVTEIRREPAGDGSDWIFMTFNVPETLTREMVKKGSVAVDGVSLTVVDVTPATFVVALIPHTLDVTTLGRRTVGDLVNIETDILGKYARKLLSGGAPSVYNASISPTEVD